jgi:hypothetical protein
MKIWTAYDNQLLMAGLRYDHMPDPACGQTLIGEVGEQHHQDPSW